MKTAIAIVAAATTLSSIPLIAQKDDAASPGNDSAKVTYAPVAGGFGDLAASHAWEMSAVTGELEGKLDSRTAKVGDRVVLKTTEKVQTSDGTIIPRGSRLVGHVTEVQAFDIEVGPGRIAIAFDHAELKNGQSIAIYTLIRGVNTSVALMTLPQEDDGGMGMRVPGGDMANGGRMGPSGDGDGGPGLSNGPAERPSDPASAGNRAGANQGSIPGSTPGPTRGPTPGPTDNTVQPDVDLSADTGAHGVAAARARPHPTNVPGVMLAGNSSSSGVLLAPLKNIQFDSGTLIQLGMATGK
jgi:hypothetical protein